MAFQTCEYVELTPDKPDRPCLNVPALRLGGEAVSTTSNQHSVSAIAAFSTRRATRS